MGVESREWGPSAMESQPCSMFPIHFLFSAVPTVLLPSLHPSIQQPSLQQSIHPPAGCQKISVICNGSSSDERAEFFFKAYIFYEEGVPPLPPLTHFAFQSVSQSVAIHSAPVSVWRTLLPFCCVAIIFAPYLELYYLDAAAALRACASPAGM